MNRPEKKEVYKPTDEQVGNGAYYDLREIKGYNQACDDWEKFLPTEEEITRMINGWFREYWDKPNGVIVEIAKAISKRLGGGKG